MAKFIPALALAVYVASMSAARAGDMAKPLGRWERKAGKSHVTLIVEENRLHVTFIGDNSCTLHADYAATRDGVIYGVVTSIDCADDEDAIKTMFDAPFSCRYRIDEGVLIVRDLRCHETSGKDNAWSGSFKAVNPLPSHRVAIPLSSASSHAPMGVFISTNLQPVWDRNFLEAYYRRVWSEMSQSNNSIIKSRNVDALHDGFLLAR